jgi:uncharacterized protein YciI
VIIVTIDQRFNMQKDEWMKDRIQHLKGLKSRSEQQELLILLGEKNDRTSADEKKLSVLVRAEKAALNAIKAKQEAIKFLNAEKNAEKKAERKNRNHELFNSAGLLIMAGLVNTKTGKPTIDKAELLGALIGLAKVPEKDPRRAEWKKAGDVVLEKAKTKTVEQ